MKRPIIMLIMATFLLFQSCAVTIKIPITKTEKPTHDGGKYVVPKFIVEKSRTPAGLLTAFIAGSVGYVLVEGIDFVLYSLSLPGKGSEPRASDGVKLLGFALGSGFSLMAWGSLGGFNSQKTTRDISSDEFDMWLRKYNLSQQDMYMKYKEDSTSYLIVPQNRVYAYGVEENRLKNEYQKRIEQMKKDTLAH
jgi:hypothetical protein